MADHKVIWSVRSLRDLDKAHDLLSEDSLPSANRTVETVLERVDQLEQFSKSGPVEPSLAHRKKEHRYLVCGHYKIIYRIEKQKVFIIRVFDTRQNPKKLK